MTATKKSKTKTSLRRKVAATGKTAQTTKKALPTKRTAVKRPTAPLNSKSGARKASKTPKKVPLKKIAAPKTVARKVAPPKAPLIETAAKRASHPKAVNTVPPPTPVQKSAAPKKTAAAEKAKKHRFQQTDLDQFKIELLAMRERITGQSGSMRNDALQRTDEVNPEEDGTDAFMRLQTLEQVSTQHQLIAKIDEALRSIEKGTYGVCDMCGDLISKPRLSVLPFAKNCIKCQAEMERAPSPRTRR